MFMFNNRTYSGPHKHYKNIYCRTKIFSVQNQNVRYITIILFQYKSIYSEDTFFNPVQMYSFSTTMFIASMVSFSVEISFFEYKIEIIIIFQRI